MEAFHRSLLDVIEVAHPSMMCFIQHLWQVASMSDRDAALTAAAVANVRPRYGFDIEEDGRLYKIVDNYDTYPSNIDYLTAISLKPKALVPNRGK